jgi:hypothetical protein
LPCQAYAILTTASDTSQHTKTEAGDHGLNRVGDAIVIWLQFASGTASGGLREAYVEVQGTRPAKNAQLHCR